MSGGDADTEAAILFGLLAIGVLLAVLAVNALARWVDDELDELKRFAKDVHNGTLDR